MTEQEDATAEIRRGELDETVLNQTWNHIQHEQASILQASQLSTRRQNMKRENGNKIGECWPNTRILVEKRIGMLQRRKWRVW